jgi:tRNA (guanine37-N1)-methyltransferase
MIKIPEPLLDFKNEIGESIISVNKNISSVYLSKGVQDEYRLHALEHIAGIDDSRTRHTEFGIILEIDIKKVYFSPRLATERYRIASQVTVDELIVDMFAGVGPFSIMISKMAEPSKIFAIDINPDAVFYLKRNLKLNSTPNVEPLEGDAENVIKTIPGFGKISRVIMNLPHSGHKYLPTAMHALDTKGMIHYYEIMEHSGLELRKSDITTYGRKHNIGVDIMGVRKVHSYSPTDALIGFDIKIDKNS